MNVADSSASLRSTRSAIAVPRVPRQAAAGSFLLLLALILGYLGGHKALLALGAAAALAFICIMAANYTLAVGLFIVTTFLQLPGTVTKPLGAVLIIGWVAILVTRKRRGFNDFAVDHRAITALLLVFTAWTLIGVAWAYSPSTVLSSLGRYIPNFFVFFIIYTAADSRRSAIQLLAAFVLGGAVAGTASIIHPPPAGADADLSRSGGTLGDPNYLAAVLVVTLALAGALALSRSRSTALRTGAVVAVVISVGGILFSLSRGGLIAMALALVTLVLVARRWRAQMLVVALAVLLSSFSYFALFASSAAVQRLTTNNNGSGRTDIWRVGLRMFEAHPFTGVGAGNFPLVSRFYVLFPGLTTHADYILTVPKVTHNMYLEILAEGGVLGLLLFLGIAVLSLRCIRVAWTAFRRSGDREMEMLSYALFAGVIGFLAASFFLSEEYSKQLWILLAYGPMIQRVSTFERGSPETRSAAPGRGQKRRDAFRLDVNGRPSHALDPGVGQLRT